jgi:hypothetical protein
MKYRLYAGKNISILDNQLGSIELTLFPFESPVVPSLGHTFKLVVYRSWDT